ncbi:MAG: tetratricopeptide repeat protein [bacterium]|nr:tetratricopeptide repeat protein [bacterium]
MKKYPFLTVITLLLSVSSIVFADDDKKIIAKANDLIKQRKYETAFTVLSGYDKNNSKPAIVIAKTELVLAYFVQSINHQLFALKDLNGDESIMGLRQSPTGSYAMISLDIPALYEPLIKKYPKNYKLQKSLGIYYYDYSQRFRASEEIIPKYQKLLITAYEHGEFDCLTLNYIANGYNYNRDYDNAILFYKKALAVEPDNPRTNFNLGRVYYVTNQLEQAVPCVKKAFEMYANPGQKQYKYDSARLLGYIYYKQKDDNNAYRYFLLADTVMSNNYDNLLNILEYEFKLQKEDKVSSSRKKLFNTNPRNLKVYDDLVKSHLHYKKLDHLLLFFKSQMKEHAKDKEISGNLYFYTAEIYYLQKKPLESKKNYELAREQFKGLFPAGHRVFEIIEGSIKRLQ